MSQETMGYLAILVMFIFMFTFLTISDVKIERLRKHQCCDANCKTRIANCDACTGHIKDKNGTRQNTRKD